MWSVSLFLIFFLLQSRCRAELHVTVQMATLARGETRSNTHIRICYFIYLFLQPHEWLAFSCQHTSVMFALPLSLTCFPSAAFLSHHLSRLIAPCECALRFVFFSRCSSSAPTLICRRALKAETTDLSVKTGQIFFFWVSPGILINGSQAHKHTCSHTLLFNSHRLLKRGSRRPRTDTRTRWLSITTSRKKNEVPTHLRAVTRSNSSPAVGKSTQRRAMPGFSPDEHCGEQEVLTYTH